MSKLETKDTALPVAPEEEPPWLDVNPCRLPLSPTSAPVTVVKDAPDWISALKDKTLVVFAGTM